MAQEQLDAFLSADKLDLLLLRDVLVGWRGVTQGDGSELPFSEEARETMLSVPYVLLALLRAYAESIAGGGYLAKKLADATRHWAGGGALEGPDAGADTRGDAAEDLCVLGAPEAAEQYRATLDRRAGIGAGARADARFPIFPENRPALELFLACATQWRYGPDGTLLGLDYAGVCAVAETLHGKSLDPALFSAIRRMEHAALKELRRRRDKRPRR